MPPLTPEVLETTDKLLRQKFDSHDKHIARSLELLKQRTAFYDRLLLLSGGTLTLSLTSATSIQQHHTLSSASRLWDSWFLLILAIICCLICNWFTLSEYAHYNRMVYNDEIGALSLMERVTHQSRSKVEDTEPLQSERTADENTKTSHKYAVITEAVAVISGIIAKFAFVLAFVFLFLFFCANITAK
jgi:hypothetical protein